MSYSKIEAIKENEVFAKCELVEEKSVELFGMYNNDKKEFDIFILNNVQHTLLWKFFTVNEQVCGSVH